MKKREKCIGCGKTFWATAVKNKVTKQTETLDNICQGCKNMMKIRQQRQKNIEMGRGQTVRVVPADLEKYIRLRELRIAEFERRNDEKEKGV